LTCPGGSSALCVDHAAIRTRRRCRFRHRVLQGRLLLPARGNQFTQHLLQVGKIFQPTFTRAPIAVAHAQKDANGREKLLKIEALVPTSVRRVSMAMASLLRVRGSKSSRWRLRCCDEPDGRWWRTVVYGT
jgi:hypothetical protein